VTYLLTGQISLPPVSLCLYRYRRYCCMRYSLSWLRRFGVLIFPFYTENCRPITKIVFRRYRSVLLRQTENKCPGLSDNTEWSKSHANYTKIFTDGCNSVQFDWINKHTMSLWLHKSPRRSRHVITCSRQSVCCLQTVEVQGCLLHKSNECSLSNTTWHLVLT
jgi:hypothetical protein